MFDRRLKLYLQNNINTSIDIKSESIKKYYKTN